MSLRLSVLVICLLALAVDSKHKHHHDKANEPEFIKNLTNVQRSSFFGIAKNQGLSIQQKEDKLVEWAEKNNLTEKYAEFAKHEQQQKDELSKNVTSVVDRLAAAKVEMDKVMADKSLTRAQQEEKFKELKKTYPQEIDTLFYIGKILKHPNGEKNETRGGSEGRGGRGHHKRN